MNLARRVSVSMDSSTCQGKLAAIFDQRTAGIKIVTAHSFDNAYITWISNGTEVWTLMAAGMGADTQTEVCTTLSTAQSQAKMHCSDFRTADITRANGQCTSFSQCPSVHFFLPIVHYCKFRLFPELRGHRLQ